MSVELTIPEVGESVTEVYIGKWYKSEGDTVEKDDPLVELESDKATLDLRAPADGVLAQILKKTGEAANVGEVIGRIDERSGPAQREKPAEKPSEESDRKPQPKATELPKPAVETPQRSAEREPAEMESGVQANVEEPPRQETSQEKPAAKIKDRVEKAASAPTQPAVDDVSAVPGQPADREDRVPMSPIRRRIAMRLLEAQQNAALLTTFNEIDMTAVKELRSRLGESFEQRHGIRLGFMSFFVKATIGALRQVAQLNAIIDHDEIVYRRYYDIGVAISTEKGLVVPVLRSADAMSFAEIETAIDEFAKRAKAGALKVDDLQGGTFTITNGGVFGSLLSTPIVNPPQSGVLGMHAIQDRPIALNDQVVIRPMMYVALTYDHRIVDGREAVTFLRHVKETIEEPSRLLIDA